MHTYIMTAVDLHLQIKEREEKKKKKKKKKKVGNFSFQILHVQVHCRRVQSNRVGIMHGRGG